MTRNKTKHVTNPSTDRDQPYLENYPELKEWIDRHGGRCMWQQRVGRDMLECWQFPTGGVAIVTLRARRMGWDVMTGIASARIDETLADAEKRLGLQETEREYRCTRGDMYPPGTPGHTDVRARQGHYLFARSVSDALARMRQEFPNEQNFTARLVNVEDFLSEEKRS